MKTDDIVVYDACQIADWFIYHAKKTGKILSLMEILKLTYFAHGWHLGLHGVPLFSNRVEAWKFGPVIPDVYNKLQHQGIHIEKPSNDEITSFNDTTKEVIKQVWDIYGHLSAFNLSNISHAKGSPWDVATKAGGFYAPISDELTKMYYENLHLRESNKIKKEN